MKLSFSGVIPAALTPFQADLSLDEIGLARHLGFLSRTPGVTGLLVNGNTSEVAACTATEQETILRIAKSSVAAGCAIYSGIQLSTAESVRAIARRCEQQEIDALVVYPPARASSGEAEFADQVVALWGVLAETTQLPLVHFQYPKASGRGYSLETIRRLAERFPSFRAIKDFCSEESMHRSIIREFQEQRGIPVLTSHTRWLKKSLEAGASGIFSSAGAIFAKQQVEALEEFRHARATSSRSVALEELMSTVSAATLNDQIPKFKVAARMRGDFASIEVRKPCTTMSTHSATELESQLAKLAYL